MSAAERLLDRLEGVRQTGADRWLAKCPAHADKSPSLSIRALDDGRVLIHDFGGCEAHAVLGVLGLTMAALFPEPLPGADGSRSYMPTHSRIPAADALAAIDHELLIACLIIDDIVERQTATEQALARLATSARRIGAARDICGANRA